MISMKYKLIYCDPPWSYKDKASAGHRGAEFKYPCLSLVDLVNMRMEIKSISDPDSVLYMWTTGPMFPNACILMESWGYTYKTIAFTWIKTNKNNIQNSMKSGEPVMLCTFVNYEGNIITQGDFMGMGNHTRSNAEYVILGVRGKGLKRISASVRSTVISPIREHSQKPDEVRERLEMLYGDVPRLEMFARVRTSNWDYHGNEERFV